MKEQPHKKQEILPTEQGGMEERFDKRFRFAGTYAMGELQANNIKSFIRQEQLALIEREIEAITTLHDKMSEYSDAEYRANYMQEVRMLLTSEKKRLMGNNN